MNKKALWFGVQANIANLIVLLVLSLITFSIIKPDYTTYYGGTMFIEWIITAISFYLIISVILKNSKDSKKEKINGLNYTLYIYIIFIICNIFTTKSPISFALILLTNLVSVGIVLLICKLKIKSLPSSPSRSKIK